MRKMLSALAGFCCFLVPLSGPSAQDEEAESRRTVEVERRRQLEREMLDRRLPDRSGDLWYGTPGVRPGGDLLVPIRDLLRNPSSLLDFRPRKVASWLPDRETAEALRERR